MRSTLLLLTLAGLALPGHELATDYAKERTLSTSSELELDLETTLMEVLIDDQPAEDPGRGGMSASLVRRSVVVDHVLEGVASEPRHVKRTFETLHDESAFDFGGEERTDEHDYPLQGVTLELSRDEDGEIQSKLVDGPRPANEELLEGHDLALALDRLLPTEEGDVDARWELDDETVRAALAAFLDPKLFAEDPPEERGEGERGGRRGGGRSRGGSTRALRLLEWEGHARLAALEEEHEGESCARIALELEGRGELPDSGSRGGRGFAFEPASLPTALGGTVEAHLEGSLFFSLSSRLPVGLELDGEFKSDSSFEREREGHRFSTHTVQSGRLTLTAEIEER